MDQQVTQPQTIIADWCNRMSRSVTRRDLAEHMQQVSEKLRVYGVPGYQQLTFLDWEKRRRYEFNHALLDTITYKLVRIKTSTPVRITFNCEESMRASNGQMIILDKDITLELSANQKLWQSVEENINHWQTHK